MHQNEESSLKRILGVLHARQQSATTAHDHRPVAAHDGLERCLIARCEKAFQQLRVGGGAVARQRQPAQVAEDAVHQAVRLVRSCVPGPAAAVLLSLVTRRRQFHTVFFFPPPCATAALGVGTEPVPGSIHGGRQ